MTTNQHPDRPARQALEAPRRRNVTLRIALLGIVAIALHGCTVSPGIGIGISGGGGWGWHPTFSAGVHVGGPIW